MLWLLSHSWMVGVTPPTRWISRDASPWLVSEVAAVVVGAVALLAWLALRRTPARGRVARWGAILGGGAALLSAVSLALWI